MLPPTHQVFIRISEEMKNEDKQGERERDYNEASRYGNSNVDRQTEKKEQKEGPE